MVRYLAKKKIGKIKTELTHPYIVYMYKLIHEVDRLSVQICSVGGMDDADCSTPHFHSQFRTHNLSSNGCHDDQMMGSMITEFMIICSIQEE